MKKHLAYALGMTLASSAFFANAAYAGEDKITDAKTLDLCVNYSALKSDDEKQRTLKELTRRAQLTEKDTQNLDKSEVNPGNTMCGMYMILGKPLQEKARQLRPMVYKVVHVYPDYYFVSQMGMITEKYKRVEGQLPPALSKDSPAVAPPPVMYNTPGGSHHPTMAK